jgi:hypothetical protein
LSPCINIAIVQAEFSCAILRLKVRCQVRMADGCRGVRSRHIIPVPTDHIMKVAASHLSLSQPLDLSPLAPLLSANQSPSTLGSIPLGPIPLSLSAHFLNVACALPERCLRASSNYLCTSLLQSALTQLTGTAYSRYLLQETCQRRSYSAPTAAAV